MEHFLQITVIITVIKLFYLKNKDNKKLIERAEYYKNKYKDCKSDLC